MYCPTCNSDIQDQARFCSSCGAPVITNAAPSTEIIAAILQIAAPFTAKRLSPLVASSLEAALYKHTSVGSLQPAELNSYINALIEHANVLATEKAIASNILAPLYCVIALGSEQYREEVEARIEHIWVSDEVSRKYQKEHTLLPPQALLVEDAPGDITGINVIEHTTLAEVDLDAILMQTDLTGIEADFELPAADQAAIDALNALDQSLKLDTLPAQVHARLADARAAVEQAPSYQNRLDLAAGRAALLLDTVPALKARLERPVNDWLSDNRVEDLTEPTKIYHLLTAEINAIGALCDKVDQFFQSDDFVARPLRSQFDQFTSIIHELLAHLAQLPNLSDEALVAVLAKLELQFPKGLPLLAPHKMRRDAYLLEQERQQRAEQDARDRAARRSDYLSFRRHLDTLYNAPRSDVTKLLETRDQSITASTDGLLRQVDNPLDIAATHYYDLLFADLHRRLTASSAKAEEAATYEQANQLYKAYVAYKDDFAEKQSGDDLAVIEMAREKVRDIEQKLLKSLAQQANTAFISIEEFLTRHSYEAALERLATIPTLYAQAELDLPPEYRPTIGELTKRARQGKEADDQAQLYLNQVSGLLAETLDDAGAAAAVAPAIDRALYLLDQAATSAHWRDTEITRRREEVEHRRQAFISTQIALASGARQRGDFVSLTEARDRLNQVQICASTTEQRDEIKQLLVDLGVQEQNQRQIASIKQRALDLAKQAEAGQDLDVVIASVTTERNRIGKRDYPALDSQNWGEIDRDLTLAEQRVRMWQRYIRLRDEAEQYATDGAEQDLNIRFAEINTELSAATYLPILADRSRLSKLVRQRSKIVRLRMMLDGLVEDLATNASLVTAERLDNAIGLSNLYATGSDTDSDIAQTVAGLENQLLFVSLRDRLAESVSDFTRFESIYQTAPDDIRKRPQIIQLKQTAESAFASSRFDTQLYTLMQEVEPQFSQGWDTPANFQHAVSQIKALREQVPLARREEPRLAGRTVTALDRLARQLPIARSLTNERNYADAIASIELMLTWIPVPMSHQDSALQPYNSELSILRNRLEGKQKALKEDFEEFKKQEGLLTTAIRNYMAVVSDEKVAFHKGKLQDSLREFAILGMLQDKVAPYTAALTAIIAVIDKLDACVTTVISQSSDGVAKVDAHGATREQTLKTLLQEIAEDSKQIKNIPPGIYWSGIQDLNAYKTLLAHTAIARIIGVADNWLACSQGYKKLPDTQLKDLQDIVTEAMAGLKLDPTLDGELQQSLPRVKTAIDQRRKEIGARKEEVDARREEIIKQQKTIADSKRRRWAVNIFGAFFLFIAIASITYLVPSTRAYTSSLLFGTPTPQPIATLSSAQLTATNAARTPVVVTPTPEPTPTLVPTPTPVPPQAGVIVFPGRINVRQRPDLSLEGITFVTAGDEVVITGYTDDPVGQRWYRLDVVTRNLRDVWLLYQAADRGQTYETVRLDGGAQLNPLLTLPYQ